MDGAVRTVSGNKMPANGWRKRQIMQWIPNDENKRRDEAFADFIGGVAYEEDRGWSKEVWDAAWSAKREWVGLTEQDAEEVERWVEFKEEGSGPIPLGKFLRYIETKLRDKNK